MNDNWMVNVPGRDPLDVVEAMRRTVQDHKAPPAGHARVVMHDNFNIMTVNFAAMPGARDRYRIGPGAAVSNRVLINKVLRRAAGEQIGVVVTIAAPMATLLLEGFTGDGSSPHREILRDLLGPRTLRACGDRLAKWIDRNGRVTPAIFPVPPAERAHLEQTWRNVFDEAAARDFDPSVQLSITKDRLPHRPEMSAVYRRDSMKPGDPYTDISVVRLETLSFGQP